MIKDVFPQQYQEKLDRINWIVANSPAGKRIIELLYDGDIEAAALDHLVGDMQSGKLEESLNV